MAEKRAPGEDFEDLAERLIREAQDRGEFSNLPGFGKPIPDLEKPRDENTWIREKLKRKQLQFLPPLLRVKREVEQALDHLQELPSAEAVCKLVQALNLKIREVQYSPLPGPGDPLTLLNETEIVKRWEQRKINERL